MPKRITVTLTEEQIAEIVTALRERQSEFNGDTGQEWRQEQIAYLERIITKLRTGKTV